MVQQAYTLLEHAAYDCTSLLYSRHLDQIILCAVYGVCKVNKVTLKTVAFRDIIYHYQKQPQCREEVFWTVILQQTDPELEVQKRGDIIGFYNKVFVPRVKNFLLSLKTLPPPDPNQPPVGLTSPARASMLMPPPSSPGPAGYGGGASASPGGAPASKCLSPLPAGLQSPRKVSAVKQNVYVSPMRSDKATASHQMTPRTKSLFAFVGESTHAYQSPVRRCKLDPSLKATCFQPLNLRVHTVLST